MIYGFEVAFVSWYFSNDFQASVALVQLFFGVVDFFHLRFALVNPPAHFAPALFIFFSSSASAALYI